MIVFAALSPAVALAGHTVGHSCTGPNDASPGCPAHTGGSPGLNYSLVDHLSLNGITSIGGLLTAILNILLVIAVPVIVFFIIFAGFTYVTAQGNSEKIKTATRSLTYAIIGAVLILGSVALSTVITNIVNSFSSGG